MTLYAIGDLHLSILSARRVGLFRKRMHYDLYKPMDVFDPVWKDHVDQLDANLHRMVKPEDTLVITGDHSWGLSLEECRRDLAFIENLPGRKILTRGNHDLFWDSSHTARLNQEFEGRLSFLQDNFFSYGDTALVGTKGICYENKDDREQFEQIRDRELSRLKLSFEAARQAGFDKYIMFLHYPPTSVGESGSCFIDLAKEYGVRQIIYSHCHGQKRYYESLHGMVDGIEYHLVSSDFLHFRPVRILP